MKLTVKDFLSKAWSKTECVAIRNCEEEDQEPEYMAVMTARDGWGDWVVDSFTVDTGCFGHDKCLHLFVCKEE